MTQRTILSDDIDNSEAASRITFSVGPDSYEIDLSQTNLDQFTRALSVYIEHARKVTPQSPPVRGPRAIAKLREVRGWARQNGRNVRDAYDSATD